MGSARASATWSARRYHKNAENKGFSNPRKRKNVTNWFINIEGSAPYCVLRSSVNFRTRLRMRNVVLALACDFVAREWFSLFLVLGCFLAWTRCFCCLINCVNGFGDHIRARVLAYLASVFCVASF